MLRHANRFSSCIVSHCVDGKDPMEVLFECSRSSSPEKELAQLTCSLSSSVDLMHVPMMIESRLKWNDDHRDHDDDDAAADVSRSQSIADHPVFILHKQLTHSSPGYLPSPVFAYFCSEGHIMIEIPRLTTQLLAKLKEHDDDELPLSHLCVFCSTRLVPEPSRKRQRAVKGKVKTSPSVSGEHDIEHCHHLCAICNRIMCVDCCNELKVRTDKHIFAEWHQATPYC